MKATAQSIAKLVFDLWSASAVPIPTSHAEESDWLVTLDGFRLLVEEKTKFENPDDTEARRRAFDAGEIYSNIAALAPNNRISGIIRKAAGQLRSTAEHVEHDARVVWLTAVGSDAETKVDQAFRTLYGSASVFDLDNSASLQDCYFFNDSAFYRYRDDLDGAILASLRGSQAKLKLCLNPFGPRWEALRDSPFAGKFPNAIVDPIAKEAKGLAMVADTPIARGDSEAMLEYLRKKHGKPHLLEMPMQMHTAAVAQKVGD